MLSCWKILQGKELNSKKAEKRIRKEREAIIATTMDDLQDRDCWSLQTQIDAFNRTIQEDLPCMIEDPQELAEYLANSIFFISMGTNDYTLNFNNHHDPEYFANSLLIQFRWCLQTLYNIGARNLVVNNIGPLGCLPSMINKTGNGQCDEQIINFWFTDVKDPCCRGYVDGKLACIPNSTPCDNRCQYLFFDEPMFKGN
ncbi:unnamed protein product [Camellia sinensis]